MITGTNFFRVGTWKTRGDNIQLLTGSEDNSCCSRNQSITDLLYLILFNAFNLIEIDEIPFKFGITEATRSLVANVAFDFLIKGKVKRV
jgi:hypothetical protein